MLRCNAQPSGDPLPPIPSETTHLVSGLVEVPPWAQRSVLEAILSRFRHFGRFDSPTHFPLTRSPHRAPKVPPVIAKWRYWGPQRRIFSVALNFPNPNRSYDAKHHCVRL